MPARASKIRDAAESLPHMSEGFPDDVLFGYMIPGSVYQPADTADDLDGLWENIVQAYEEDR